MIVKPTVIELLEKAENRYSLVIATAKRARQIASGSIPMTSSDDVSPVTLAADEIEEEKVKIYNKSQWDEEIEKRKELISKSSKDNDTNENSEEIKDQAEIEDNSNNEQQNEVEENQ